VGHNHGTGDGVFGEESNMNLVYLPKSSKALGCRRVFRKKDNEQYMIRLVAKEYSQNEGINYNEIFSSIVKYTSIRLLLAIVAQGDLELEQFDVKIKFSIW